MDKKIIINIGRQFGGGGVAVAMELGRKLGIPVYDKELILRIPDILGDKWNVAGKKYQITKLS